jgi:hypothetical protein
VLEHSAVQRPPGKSAVRQVAPAPQSASETQESPTEAAEIAAEDTVDSDEQPATERASASMREATEDFMANTLRERRIGKSGTLC